MSKPPPLHRARQRGAATLVVVMVLFFIMAMMAAYASRNMVFEQRIASNYYRSGLALETAEAGGEWVLSALNGIAIDAACDDSAALGTSFRSRYLNIDAQRVISAAPDADALTDPSVAACVSTAANGWTCQCPVNGTLSAPNIAQANGLQPMFALQFQNAGRPGVIGLRVLACTGLVSECTPTNQAGRSAAANSDLARSVLRFNAALVSALKVPPASPLTVRGTVDFGSPGLGLRNTEPTLSGLLMQAGDPNPRGETGRMRSLPGTPARDALIGGDTTLSGGTPADMFKLFFGMAPATYRQQPAMRLVTCAANDCNDALQAAYASGARLLWVEGTTHIAGNINLGSTADPFVLVVNGGLTLDNPLLNGLVYVRGDVSWQNSSGALAQLTGALLSEGNFAAQGPVDISYHAGLIGTIRNQLGSFVRVPGSWTDDN